MKIEKLKLFEEATKSLINAYIEARFSDLENKEEEAAIKFMSLCKTMSLGLRHDKRFAILFEEID